MGHNYLIDIMENYRSQYRLYEKMEDLSSRQLNLLQGIEVNSDLSELLQDRKDLMDEIVGLNQANKQMQEQLRANLEMGDFTVSGIESRGETDLAQELKALLSSISNLLNKINENDIKNESLMRQFMRSKRNSTTSAQAGDIYQEVMQGFKSGHGDK